MTMPIPEMTRPVGSPGGLKTQAEYDNAWADLSRLNSQLYGPESAARTRTQAGAQPVAQASGNYSAYSSGQAQSQQSPYANATPYGQQQGQQQAQTGGYQAYSQQQGGYQQQMPSFQFTGGTDWMGNQYTDPNAMMAQQGAMALALNQQRQGMLGQGQFGSLNPQMAYDQGMGMLQQGWQNPFAAPPAFQDPGNNIRNLLQGYGIPQNVMDQLTGMFGGQQGGAPPMSPGQAGQQGPQPGVGESGERYPPSGLPAGMYRPDNLRVDRGPDWHAVYSNPATGETFRSYKNTVRPEEGSGWVRQGSERGSQGGQATGPGQAQAIQDPYGSSTTVSRPSNRPPLTAEEPATRQQAEIKQKGPRISAGRTSIASATKPRSATEQWRRIQATTNTQTKPLTPAHQRVWEAMVAESRRGRGTG